MQVHLRSGNYNVIANGEVFLFAPYGDLTIQVDDSNAFQVKIVIKFTKDSSGERDIRTVVSDDALVITCVNFDGMSAGLKCPTHIADVNEKKVYLMFSTDCTGDTASRTRSVKYTIFQEPLR